MLTGKDRTSLRKYGFKETIVAGLARVMESIDVGRAGTRTKAAPEIRVECFVFVFVWPDLALAASRQYFCQGTER
jgi:hypothetical protein